MTPLRQRMIDAMVLRGFAARTQETCLTAVSQWARHHHRSPELLSDEQVQACLLYLLQAAARRSRSPIGVDAQPVSDLQIQIEQARVRQMQTDAEIARIQAETERMRLATERLRAARTSQETADTIRPVQNWFNTNEPDKAQKAAEEALDAIKDEMNRAAVKNSNNIFMTIILAFAILFSINISRRISGVVQMNYQQRFGVTVMVCAFMMTILAVVISDGWYPNADVIQNILVSIRIQLLKDADTYPYNGHMIDIPTKYVLLACIAAAAYGYMTFLGVAPAWKRKTPDPVVPSIPSDQE